MSRTASVETVNRGERSCVHPTPKMIDPKMFFFYAKEEKAYKICYKGLVQAYPNAVFKVVSGYGHMTYSVRHTNEYVQLLRDACV